VSPQNAKRLFSSHLSHILKAFASDIKLDPNKLFEDMSWADLIKRMFESLTSRCQKISNNQLFWEGVHIMFEGQDEAYNNMHFVDDEVFSDLHHISFGRVVSHSWKKLRDMWKSLNVECKHALSHFTMSRMHTSNFSDFCNGYMTFTI